MLSRISQVNHLTLNSLLSSSLCQIGDSTHIVLKTRVLAIKREYPLFYGREGDFNSYDVFNEPIPQPINEFINMQVNNTAPLIKVDRVTIRGCSFSSVIHVGSTCTIDAEARIKHIRQLEGDTPQTPDISIEKQLSTTASELQETLQDDATR
ncbi:spore germination protein GerPE [Priestia flexa]|nr:spore germination protein GerPE [Priestia flexa]